MSSNRHTTPLHKVLKLRADAARPRAFATDIPPDWSQGRATFAGLLAAIAIRGLQSSVQGKPLRSFVMDCLAPATPGELSIEVELLCTSKSLAHARATLSQGDHACAVLMGTFGATQSSAMSLPGPAAQPSVLPPEQLVQLPYIEGAMPVFTQHFDYRWTSTHGLFSGAENGEITGFVRALDADRVDVAVIAALIDSFPPPVLTQLRAPAPSSTATWMVNFTHARPALAPNEFCRYESRTNSASGGYASFDAKLWDAEGHLLAESRQLAVESA
jgi:acyl-CoA thioesterase